MVVHMHVKYVKHVHNVSTQECWAPDDDDEICCTANTLSKYIHTPPTVLYLFLLLYEKHVHGKKLFCSSIIGKHSLAEFNVQL